MKLDFVVERGGWMTDACMTVPVGTCNQSATQLMQVTRQALYDGIAAARSGARVGDISHAVESCVTPHGYSPVRACVGAWHRAADA